MTRINLVEPRELSNQHLMAEYREIFMVGSSLQRSLKSPNFSVNRIPKEFTLNKGHVMFFYDKGKYLHNRYRLLRKELLRRGFKIDVNRTFKVEQWKEELYNDWKPSDKDLEIIRQRIQEKIDTKPDWYVWHER